MKIKLKKLTLKYFKGFIDQTIDFSDKTNIYLENKGGKTSVQDAVFWLFFGKHADGKTDLDIKTKCTSRTQSHFPKNKIGDVIHNLTHSVTGLFEFDGREIEMQKTFAETWGTTAKVKEKHLKTHTTRYSFDGHKCPKKKYEEELSKFIDERTFRLLTDPKYFSNVIHWSERRQILTDMHGKTDQSKIPGFKKVEKLLGTWTAEEKKQDLKSEIKLLKEEKEKIPTQIEENRLMFIEVETAIRRTPEALSKAKQKLEERIQATKNDSGHGELKRQIADIDAEIIQKTNEFNAEKSKKIVVLQDKKINLNNSSIDLKTKINNLKDEQQTKTAIIENKKNEALAFKDKWEEVANKPETIQKVCPTCEQPLLESAVKLAQDNYNLKKSSDLELLKTKSLKLKALVKKLQSEVEPLPKQIKGDVDGLSKLKTDIDAIQSDIDYFKNQKEVFLLLEEKKHSLKNKILNAEVPDTSDLEKQIDAINTESKEIQKAKLDVEKNAGYTKRISELEDREKKLSQDQADLEKQLTDLETFIIAKIESMEAGINGMFEFTTFKMFHQNINEGTKEICETMNDGVLYQSVNSAGQIQSGIDIIKTLQKHHGIQAPIFIDNRESVTELPETDCQMISLFVSPNDKKMRIKNV